MLCRNDDMRMNSSMCTSVLEALREREKQRALNEQVRNRKRSSRIERKTEEERRRAEEIAARQKYEQQTARQRSMGSQKAVPSQQEVVCASIDAIGPLINCYPLSMQRDRQLKERQMAERERRRVEREQAIAMRAERQLQAQLKLAQKQSAMEATATTASSSTSSWMFSCACGVTGQNLDDGQPMVACEGCNEWQHISCAQVQALRRGEQPWRDERDEFICERCHSKGVRESTADVGADDDDMELDVVGDDGNEEDSQEVGAIPATSTSAAHAHMAPLSPNILRIPSPAKIATATAPVAKCAPPAIARIPSPVARIKSTSPRLVAVPMASASPLPHIARIPSPVAVNLSTSPRLSMVDMIVPPAIARIPSPVAPKKSTSPQVIPTAHMPPTIAPPLSPTRQLIGTVLRGAFADALDYAAAKTTATRAATEQ